jgi:hypothetical protein
MEYEINSDECISQAVLCSVSEFENTDISNLPRLYDSIEPDALNIIFSNKNLITLSFTYSNSVIDIYNGEYLIITAT